MLLPLIYNMSSAQERYITMSNGELSILVGKLYDRSPIPILIDKCHI